ncbi:MAG TPA: TIGR01777 family oxidoreductase [Terriglobales bacterium]|nr:TIGR01777 family oxidoreductase [Terriglobales bacterium]
MKVAVSGASGFIGAAVVRRLEASGHQVSRMVRGNARPGEIHWIPAGALDAASLEGFDAVVHLAAENISGRWTATKKARILNSRVQGTLTIAAMLARLQQKPKVLVSASAIGFYGSRGDENLDESSAPGSDFLAEVARQWESATEAASRAGIRVALVRFGVVLGASGGALKQMLGPFQMGVGGRIGSGQQWMSWVGLEDAAGAVEHAIVNDAVRGPVNVVAPNPVRNTEFTKTLGEVLHRPTVFPMPEFAVKVAFGEMGVSLLLGSQRVMPKKLQESGYQFRFPELRAALENSIGR